MRVINTPLNDETINSLKCGERVHITGFIYTARDAAHKRLYEAILNNESLPIDLKGNIIYYMGPTPSKPGMVIGSCGPTTSGRMDKYTPSLLDLGLKGMIGKGERNSEVIESIVKNGCVYFGAVGGAGALISKCVKSCEIIAYPYLGTEAIRKLYVENMPVTVIIDNKGKNIFAK